MVIVERDAGVLMVSEGPGSAYKVATCAWPFCALLTSILWLHAPWHAVLSKPLATITDAVLVASALLGMLALVWGWSTTSHRFDRNSGMLVISHSAPGRRPRQRHLLLSTVLAIVDRRLVKTRAIELLLFDRTTLVIARMQARSAALDLLSDGLSQLLHKPIHMARGALIADRFQIERFVEQGGMGAVYRALDRSTGETVALKLAMIPNGDPELGERFARETAVLAVLDHPRVVKYVSHGTTKDAQAYLAMQWLDGQDLRVALAARRLSLAECMDVLMGAASALAAVHEHGIVHRDLKPANLLLRGGSASDVVLLDFGVAHRLAGAERLTRSAAIIGTPHYMAPEQASSAAEICPAADIFALGCIFYECLTGVHPFDAPQLVGVLSRILYDAPEAVETLCPALPEAWSALLTRMLHKDPNQRPRDGQELSQELVRLAPQRAEPSDQASGRPTVSTTELDVGDQILVSVVLATLAHIEPAAGEAKDSLDSIRSATEHFGCSIERLADGSLLATVLPQHSATDQVRIAAACALYLRELLPAARISIATGRAPALKKLRVGDTVDRAVLLLESALSDEAVRLDTVTAGLLDRHFVTGVRDGVTLLLGQKQDLDETRLLLGKPTPCVGRELELVQLENLMARAFEEGVPKAAVVLGPPGIGKSRLRHELVRRLLAGSTDCAVLLGYGDPLSAGSPYVLLADALKRHAGIRTGDDLAVARRALHEGLCRHLDPAQQQRVSEFLGEACGIPFPDSASAPLRAARGDHRVMSEQITIAFVDWLAAECRAHPVAFLLEDVQWADALTLNVLEAALRDLRDAPLCILSFGRPEAETSFSRLFFGQRALALPLGALSDKASELLARGVLDADYPSEAFRRIVRLAAGNALFLEELIRAAALGTAGDVPETVLAMLQARLSGLSPDARQVLRAASVLGERFWHGGMIRVFEAWGNPLEPERCLSQLIELELVERARASDYPPEAEYRFRHALVCDAAYGLLTDADRRTGHMAAGTWLEMKGEADGIVLARHAEEAGDSNRAISFYTRAAEQSLGQYDFVEALARARKGIASGAQGCTLGVLQSIQASALYSMGQFLDSAEVGLQALALLPQGGVWWCSTVEKLMQVMPNVNRMEECNQLADLLLRVQPEVQARAAHVRALHVQLLGYSVSANHERGWRTLEFIDQLGVEVSEADVATRGYARLWRSVLTAVIGDDLQLALRLSQQAIEDLSESQVLYRLTLAHTLQSFVWWELGQLERSEAAARQARAIAEQIHDEYHAALAAWYLSVALADSTDPEKLNEAEECARAMVLGGENPLFDAVSQVVLARLALLRKDWAEAETAARQARTGLVAMPPYALMASASLVLALANQGRSVQACMIAREDLELLERIDGPVSTEVLFRVAAADVLHGAGHLAEARSVLAEARRQIDIRSTKITDPALRNSYLSRRPENRRARELEVQTAESSGELS